MAFNLLDTRCAATVLDFKSEL